MKDKAKRARKRRKLIEPIKNKFSLFEKFRDGIFYPKIHKSFPDYKERKRYMEYLYKSLE